MAIHGLVKTRVSILDCVYEHQVTTQVDGQYIQVSLGCYRPLGCDLDPHCGQERVVVESLDGPGQGNWLLFRLSEFQQSFVPVPEVEGERT